MKYFVVLCLIELLPIFVQAQNEAALPQELTLERVMTLAKERAPRLRAEAAGARIAEVEVDLAGLYPNPAVSYSVYGRTQGAPNAINGSQHQVWLEQSILVGSQNVARRNAASGEARARRAEFELFRFEFLVEARRRFAMLVAAQRREEIFRRGREELKTVLSLVEARASAGAQSAYDVSRVQLEAAQLENRLAEAIAQREEKSGALGSLLGLPSWHPTAMAPDTVQFARLHVDTIWRVVSDHSIVLRAARENVIATTLQVRRFQRERWPTPTFGLGAYLTTDGNSSSLYGGISMPIPLWDLGNAAVARARAIHDAAELERDAREAELRALLEAELVAYEMRRQALLYYDQHVTNSLDRLREMAEASYRSGATRVLELLDSFNALLRAHEERVDLVERVELDFASVQSTAGIDITQIAR